MSVHDEEKTPANGDIREGANVDKIRDILFGSQMRDYDKRFVRLEERLAKAADALRDDLKKRFDSLEAFVQQEVSPFISACERKNPSASRRSRNSRGRRATLRGPSRTGCRNSTSILCGPGRSARENPGSIQGAAQRDPEIAQRDGIHARARSRNPAERQDRSRDARRLAHRDGAAAQGRARTSGQVDSVLQAAILRRQRMNSAS